VLIWTGAYAFPERLGEKEPMVPKRRKPGAARAGRIGERQEVLHAFHEAVNMAPGELETWLGSTWRYSLMNWGHDPRK
jgi:hypothetical protein